MWWVPYVPRPVLDLLALGADPRGRVHRSSGAALFADVSGFTALSEALAVEGPRGAEALTLLLNRTFAPLIGIVDAHGGWVGKFGGDALTAVFDGADALDAAAAAGLAMQAAMAQGAEIEAGGRTFRLGIKIGIAPGTLGVTLAGDPALRLELLLGGTAIDGAAEAEHAARPGEVASASPSDGFRSTPRGTIHLVQASSHEARPAAATGPAPDHPAGAAFLHPAIAARLASGRSRFVQEHRRVTVLFARFGDQDVEALAPLVASLVATVHRYGGYLNKVDLGDKGTKALILFGTPVAHEDDTSRALHCALALAALAPMAAGIHSGLVYAGDFGSEGRREYTVIGDAVNVAARLMQAAGALGKMLVSAEVADRSTGFVFGPAAPHTMKGRSASLLASPLLDVRRTRLQRHTFATPMVGRTEQRQRVAALCAEARTGRGRTVLVVGDAGMGKSRLVEELLRDAEQEGFEVSGGASQAHVREPFDTWRDIWRDLFPLGPGEGADAVEARLRAMDPGLLSRMPLLSGPLGLPLPATPLSAGLSDTARARVTADLCARVLTEAAQRAPRLLLLEDAHWLDPASERLLEALVPVVAHLPVVLLVACRPEAQGLLAALGRRPEVETLELGPFHRDETAALVASKLGGLVLPDAVLDRIAEHAGGNPFYADELVSLVRDRGLDCGAPSTWAQLELPRSLEALVHSRIDRLDEDEKLTLKAASVIGRTFRLSWLCACCPELGEPSGIAHRLDHLSRLEITPVDDPTRRSWLFRHALTQQAAYATLSVGNRTELHHRLARVLAEDPEIDPIVIAWHCAQTTDVEMQRTWYRRAGDAGVRANDPATAMVWYERWLPIGTDDDRDAVLYEMGGIAHRAGRDADAERWWAEALALAEHQNDVATASRIRIGLATMRDNQGQKAEAEALLLRAVADLPAETGPTVPDRVAALTILARNRRTSDPEAALAHAKMAVALAETLGDPGRVGRAAAVVGMTLLRRPESVPEAEPWLIRAQSACEEADDAMGITWATTNRAIACWWTGRAAEATVLWSRTIAEFLRLGDHGAAWTQFGNLAQVHLNRRSVDTTRPMQALRCDVETSLDRWSVASQGLPSLLQTAYFHPDLWDLAAAHAGQLVTIVRTAAPGASWKATAAASAALVCWRVGDDDRALAFARECLAMPTGTLVDEAHGWAACWGQLAGRRRGTWTAEDDRRVTEVGAAASARAIGYFRAAEAIAGRDVAANLEALDVACDTLGDVFLHAIREALTGVPVAAGPALTAPPDMGRAAPDYPTLFAAIDERWTRFSGPSAAPAGPPVARG